MEAFRFFCINEKNSQEIRYVLSNQTRQCYTSITARENVKNREKEDEKYIFSWFRNTLPKSKISTFEVFSCDEKPHRDTAQ